MSVEEQQIILNVAKYFQEESKSGNKSQFRAGAVLIAKTAAATGVSKNSVRKIVSAGKVITLYNVCAVPWGCSVPWRVFSTVGGYHEYCGGYLEYRGGYLEYRGGCSVPWLLMKEKLVKQRYDLGSWITLMLVSSEESFIICIGRIFLPV